MSDRAGIRRAFARYGVATVISWQELLRPRNDNGGRLSAAIVSVSCSGGEASLVADRTEHGKPQFEPFTEQHASRIESTLTELVTVSNPFDYHTFMWRLRRHPKCFTRLDGPYTHDAGARRPPSPDNDPRRGSSHDAPAAQSRPLVVAR